MTNGNGTRSNGRRPLRLFHASDLHFLGDGGHQRTVNRMFPTIADAVHRLGADVLILAGDIFDTPITPPEEVEALLDALGKLPVPVIVLPGNHDAHVFTDLDPSRWPANAHLLRESEGQCVELSDLGLTVWGKPTYDHTPAFRPLVGLPPRPVKGWFVAVAHGLVFDQPDFAGRSSLILQDELAAADCDYIALGHVHAFRDVTRGSAPAFYSGAPWGSTTTPTGALVSLHPSAPTDVQPITLPIA